jgi:cytochrome c-type biogenesis protein
VVPQCRQQAPIIAQVEKEKPNLAVYGRAAMVMATFSLGAATPILVLAYGSRQAIVARRDLLARTSQIAKPLMGAALVGIGVFVLTGFDKIVEASLTRAMPDWLVSVTTRL